MISHWTNTDLLDLLSLAYHEIRLIISTLLWNFDLELDDRTSKDWLDQKNFVVWAKKPLLVRLSSRKLE